MATTTVQDFVDAIATKASIDPVTAETAVGDFIRELAVLAVPSKLVSPCKLENAA
jgi:hypothetical protein